MTLRRSSLIAQRHEVPTTHLTPHTSHLIPHTSFLTPHTSHLIPHTPHPTPHTPHFTPHTSQTQLALAVLDSVALEFRGTRLVLPEYFHEGTWREPERRRSSFRIAVLCGHDVKDMGDEQRKLWIARLDMPVAARKFHLDFGRSFADIQRKCHLHAVQCMNFVFFCTSAFGRLYF